MHELLPPGHIPLAAMRAGGGVTLHILGWRADPRYTGRPRWQTASAHPWQ
jgi:hypothetical protein